MKTLQLGLVGLDTSHVLGFASHFNQSQDPHHTPGGRVVCAFPGGSPDFPLSIDRVPGYSAKLRDEYGVRLLGSPHEVAAEVDAVLHTTVDGRAHLPQFSEMASLRRPTFLDKPFATTSADARAIIVLARQHSTPLFSSSSLRFADALQTALADVSGGPIIGADFSGPLHLQATQPGFIWYGIHTVEMVYAALGCGCVSVRVISTSDHEIAVGVWRDGRIGIARGNRAGNNAFTGVIHREKSDQWIDASIGQPADVGLTKAIMAFFQGDPAPVSLDETSEIIRFLEAANESRAANGREIPL